MSLDESSSEIRPAKSAGPPAGGPPRPRPAGPPGPAPGAGAPRPAKPPSASTQRLGPPVGAPPPGAAPAPPRPAGPPVEVVIAKKVGEAADAIQAKLRDELASQLDAKVGGEVDKRLTADALGEVLLPKIREAAADAARTALEDLRAAFIRDAVKSVLDDLVEGVVANAAEKIVPKLLASADPKELDSRVVERAVKETVEVLKKQRDLDVLMEKLAGEASTKAYALAREGLDKIVERIAERVTKDATAWTLPKVQEKIKEAVLANAIQEQVAKLAAHELTADLAAVKNDLAGMPERIAREALARANAGIEIRLREISITGIAAPPAHGHGHAAPAAYAPPPAVPTLRELEPILKRYVAEYTIDADNLVKRATDGATKSVLATIEPKIPPKIDVEKLKIDLYRHIRAEMPSIPQPVASTTPAHGTALPFKEEHFRALAREVKNLKQQVNDLVAQMHPPEEPAADGDASDEGQASETSAE